MQIYKLGGIDKRVIGVFHLALPPTHPILSRRSASLRLRLP